MKINNDILKDLTEELQKILPSLSIKRIRNKIIIEALLFSNQQKDEIFIQYKNKALTLNSKMFIEETPFYLFREKDKTELPTIEELAEEIKRKTIFLVQERIDLINKKFTENFKSEESEEDIRIRKFLEINSINSNMTRSAFIAFVNSFGDSINNYEISLRIFKKIKEIDSKTLLYAVATRKNGGFNSDVRNMARIETIKNNYTREPCTLYKKWRINEISPLTVNNFWLRNCPPNTKDIFEINEIIITDDELGCKLSICFPDLKKINKLNIVKTLVLSPDLKTKEKNYKDLAFNLLCDIKFNEITIQRMFNSELINAFKDVCNEKNISLKVI